MTRRCPSSAAHMATTSGVRSDADNEGRSCQYPTDWVPLCTRLKRLAPRLQIHSWCQEALALPHALRHRARHPPEEGSGVAMYPMAQSVPPARKRLRCHHVPRGTMHATHQERAPVLPCAPGHRARHLAGEGSGVATHLVAPGPPTAPLGAPPSTLSQTWWWTLPDPPAASPRGPPSTLSSNLVVDAARLIGSAPQGARHRHHLQPWWWMLPDPLAVPPGGSPSTSSSKLGGGRCRTHRQHPPRGPPSTSYSTWVVESAGLTDSAPYRGVHHRRRLQPRWWTLPDLPATPPRGPAIDVISNLNGGHCRTHRQRPQGARHQCLAATGSHCQYPLPTPPRGPLVDYHYWACYKQDI
jgi:hypothetical protein